MFNIVIKKIIWIWRDTINISISKTKNSRLKDVDFNNLPFGHIKSDHMFVAKYRNGEWNDFEILPYQNLELSTI